MDPQNSQPDDSDAYLASFEASNRKRKILIISAAIVATIVAVGAFVATLGSLGRMSEDVQGAFTEGTEAKPGEAPSPGATSATPSPAGTDTGAANPADSAPASNASSAPAGETAPPANTPPAETNP